MSKALSFQVTAPGRFDGATAFNLTDPLPAPNASDQIVIPITTSVGQLNPASMAALVGSGGYWVRSVLIDNPTANVDRIIIGPMQPATGVAGDPDLVHPIVLDFAATTISSSRARMRGGYVPAGWPLVFQFDDGAGGIITGPYTVVIEVEALKTTEEAARAIKATPFPVFPISV